MEAIACSMICPEFFSLVSLRYNLLSKSGIDFGVSSHWLVYDAIVQQNGVTVRLCKGWAALEPINRSQAADAGWLRFEASRRNRIWQQGGWKDYHSKVKPLAGQRSAVSSFPALDIAAFNNVASPS
jgi:hypothetical protein